MISDLTSENLARLAQRLNDKEWSDVLMYAANRLGAFADDSAELADWRAMYRAFSRIPVVGGTQELWPNNWRQEVALVAFALTDLAKHKTEPALTRNDFVIEGVDTGRGDETYIGLADGSLGLTFKRNDDRPEARLILLLADALAAKSETHP